MGGTLLAGILSLQNADVGAFATIGSPWDFSASRGVTATLRSKTTGPQPAEMIENMGRLSE